MKPYQINFFVRKVPTYKKSEKDHRSTFNPRLSSYWKSQFYSIFKEW